jgi:hypothetical protein
MGNSRKEPLPMATVGKELAELIIANNGEYGGDPPVVKVVRYKNQFNGDLAYGLIYEGEDPMRYHNSPACHDPQTIFERK